MALFALFALFFLGGGRFIFTGSMELAGAYAGLVARLLGADIPS
jgi:hypothetical protein